jgi:hypothetical protein
MRHSGLDDLGFVSLSALLFLGTVHNHFALRYPSALFLRRAPLALAFDTPLFGLISHDTWEEGVEGTEEKKGRRRRQ